MNKILAFYFGETKEDRIGLGLGYLGGILSFPCVHLYSNLLTFWGLL